MAKKSKEQVVLNKQQFCDQLAELGLPLLAEESNNMAKKSNKFKDSVKIDTVFTNKVLVTGLDKERLEDFLVCCIEQAWLASRVPDVSRKVKQPVNPVIDDLPVDARAVVKAGIKKGSINLEKIGAVYVGLNVKISVVQKVVTPHTTVEFDRFVFERDDHRKNMEQFIKMVVGVLDARSGS